MFSITHPSSKQTAPTAYHNSPPQPTPSSPHTDLVPLSGQLRGPSSFTLHYGV